MNVDELIDEIPPERDLIAFSRALRKVGVANEIHDGRILATEFEDMDDLQAVVDTDDFREAYRQELISWATDHLLSSLHAKGVIEPSVREDGSLQYTLSEYGAMRFEQEYGEPPTGMKFTKRPLDSDGDDL